jgi:hypothetical protein
VKRTQWQAAAKALLDGADAEAVTKAVELALFVEARLDVRLKPAAGGIDMIAILCAPLNANRRGHFLCPVFGC